VPVPADVIDTVIGASTHRDTYQRPGVRRRPGRGAGGDCDPAFVDRAGHLAEGWEDDEKVMQTFEQAHRQKTKKLDQAGLLPSVAWDQLRDRPVTPPLQWDLLGQEADLRQVGGNLARRAAEHPGPSGGRRGEPGQQPQQRGLARSVRPD
jgi:hypothetical protein